MESQQQFGGAVETKEGDMSDLTSDPPVFVPKANKGSGTFPGPDGKMVEIRDVWRGNLEEEMCNIRKVRRRPCRCRGCHRCPHPSLAPPLPPLPPTDTPKRPAPLSLSRYEDH